MPTCLMCREMVKKLERCHIYPKAMTRYLAGDANKLVSMSIRQGPRASSGLGGMYDDTIVCSRCERTFFAADDYAIAFWKALLNTSIRFKHPYGLKLREYDVDPNLLHTFCIQTLLRAHYSKRWVHDQVDLEESGLVLAETLLAGKSTLENGPEVALRFVKDNKAANALTPYVMRSKIDEIYVLSFPHLQAHIACNGKLPQWYGPTILRAQRQVTVFHCRKLYEDEERILKEMYAPNAIRAAKIMG